jgi:hypothetical protein
MPSIDCTLMSHPSCVPTDAPAEFEPPTATATATAATPLPFRCRVDADGLRVSWLLVSQRIPWTSVEATAVEKDARRWVLGARRNVLVVRRAHRRALTLSAKTDVLAALARDVAHFAPQSCQVLV